MMALFAVYERRTFRLPPLELLRIVLGFTMPILLIGHAASTRLAYEMFGLSSDYTRVVSNLWATGSQGWQLGLMAPGWLHGCLGLHFAFSRRWWYRRFRFVLFSAACCCRCWRRSASSPWARSSSQARPRPRRRCGILESGQRRAAAGDRAVEGQSPQLVFLHHRRAFIAREIRNLIERRGKRLVSMSYPGRTVRVPRGWSVLEASRSFHLPTQRCAAAGRAARPAGSG